MTRPFRLLILPLVGAASLLSTACSLHRINDEAPPAVIGTTAAPAAGPVLIANPNGTARLPIGDPKFPISAAVIVPAGYDTIYVSGALPDVANPDAPKGTVESYGGTEVQTASVLKKLGGTLNKLGLTYADVVAAHVYLVGDPRRSGDIDFAGMNAAFGRVFGTPEQPTKPARAAMKVDALVVPGTLVEIEFVAARKR